MNAFLLLLFFPLLLNSACGEELQKPEPGKKIKVFLFAGQSNMEGRAHGRKLPVEDLPRLENAQKQIQFAFNHKPLGPLDVAPPTEYIRKIYKRDRIFGPELYFGMAMAEAMPEEKFLFIKLAVGSTSLLGCWNPEWSKEKAAVMKEEKHPKLYRDLIDYVQGTLKGYSPDDYEICAMFWVQGEKDAQVPQAEESYGENLANLIDSVRKDLGEEQLPFILFQVGSKKVGKGMKKTAKQLSDVILVPRSDNPISLDYYDKMENGHYNIQGFKKLGTRFSEIYLERYSGR